jgi:hypothetical protein
MASDTTLSITINENGSVSVNGPIDDKMLCYALLELARDAVKDFQKPEPKIQPAAPSDIVALTSRRVQ